MLYNYAKLQGEYLMNLVTKIKLVLTWVNCISTGKKLRLLFKDNGDSHWHSICTRKYERGNKDGSEL